MEAQIETKLKQLKRAKKYIAVSLWPSVGSPTIEKEGNRMLINEGRDGKWEGVSEEFYDRMAQRYDSRG